MAEDETDQTSSWSSRAVPASATDDDLSTHDSDGPGLNDPNNDTIPTPTPTPRLRPSYPPPPRATKPTISKLVKRSSASRQDDLDEVPEGPAGLNFSIRFTSQGQEDLLDLWVGEKESVRDVKRRIRFLRPSLMTPEGRPLRLRLIQLGRLLTDGTFLVPWTVQLLSHRAKLVKTQEDDFVGGVRNGGILEAVGREIGFDMRKDTADGAGRGNGKGKGKERERTDWDGIQGGENGEDKMIWLHCSVGEAMEDDEIEGERVQTTQIKPLEGFDRLVDAGFTPEEIATMREEFRASAAATLPAGGDEDEHARALEDQWMEGLTGQDDAALESPSTGDQMALLQGICMGFFLPFLPFFFFRTQIFSQQTQMGVLGGAVINVSFAIMRMLN